jgi:cytochrome c553
MRFLRQAATLCCVILVVLVSSASILGCDRPPAAQELAEWTPRDHHSADDDKMSMRAPKQVDSAPRRGGESDVAQLVDITWRQQCTNCHGATGKGDGQMGALLRAPDLTRTEWQSSVTDGDVAAMIRNGKNRMPKFDLPDPVVQGLVARIRALRGSPQ